MPDASSLAIYLSAAFLLAITPGPGILYVLTRSLKGGRAEGYASSFGTAIGGMFHVIVAAFGLSAFLATSALAFSLVKYAGAAYLIYLGIRAIMNTDTDDVINAEAHSLSNQLNNHGQAFRQGIITELLNPKTALFFLAFIPQFVNPEGVVLTQFLILGTISIIMNTTADVVIATLAGPIGYQLKSRPKLRQFQQKFTGTALIALGVYVALADSGETAQT